MIDGLKGFFKQADNLQDLEKRSEKFEQMLFDGINALEGINKIYNNSLKIHDNETLKNSLSEEEHSAISVDFATGQITWNDLKSVASYANELREIYKAVYKKDAVTAASTLTNLAIADRDMTTISNASMTTTTLGSNITTTGLTTLTIPSGMTGTVSIGPIKSPPVEE